MFAYRSNCLLRFYVSFYEQIFVFLYVNIQDMKSRLKNILFYSIAVVFFTACNSKTYKEIDYLQNIVPEVGMQMKLSQGLVIQPKDLLSIIVTSNDPLLSSVFNLTLKAYEAGSPSDQISSSYEKLLGYFVDDDGMIDFPGLGKLKVSGLNRRELEEMLSDELVSRGGLIEPHVVVEFLNSKFTVIGEVNHPGQYHLANEKVSILQALSLAGDMTIYGRRDNVRVIREQNGERQVYVLDVKSREMFNSPGYYLQQNDIVYVCPSNVRAGSSTINENYVRSGSFILSLSSLAVVLTNFLIKIL